MSKSVRLTSSRWTEISSSTMGMMQNTDVDPFIYRAETALPSASINSGHILKSNQKETWTFYSGEKIYGRSLFGDINIAVTEG